MGDNDEMHLSRSVGNLDISEDKPDLVKAFDKLSPDSQSSVQVLMQKIAKGDVYLNVDESGKQILEYQEQKQRSYVDASQANILVKPRTEEDTQVKVDACLELIDFLKHDKPPAGVILDASKIQVKQGKYREHFEFNRTKQILGSGNSAGDIIVVKDKKTNQNHALKTIMISVFRKQEIQCWVDLAVTGRVPSLYVFTVRDNKVEVHMEILKESFTMRSIIDDHMHKIDRSLHKPFSLYVLKGTLEAVADMHGKNWVHKDLHAGNVMLQKSKEMMLDLKIIDFGMASHLETLAEGLDFRGFRSDIASVLRMFCALYVGIEFDNVLDIQKNWKEGLEHVTCNMNQDDKEELFCLIDSAMCIVHPDDVSNFNKQVKDKLNRALSEKGQTEIDVLKEVAALLYPERTSKQADVELDDADCAGDAPHKFDSGDGILTIQQQCGFVCQRSPHVTISDEFISKLRLSMSIGPAA